MPQRWELSNCLFLAWVLLKAQLRHRLMCREFVWEVIPGRRRWGQKGTGVIQSSVVDLAIIVGNWCLILLGPFEKPYDVSQNSVPRN